MASVIGCSVISMENYRTGADEGNDLSSIDFDLLVQNLQVKKFLSKINLEKILISYYAMITETL